MPEPPELQHKSLRNNTISLSSDALIELLRAVHEKGADFRFTASGMSMYPAIREGDVITLSPRKSLSMSIGDVVAFRHPDTGKMLVHRIVRVESDFYEIQGDNCAMPDGTILRTGILGLVTRVERDGSSVFWPDKRRYPLWGRIYFLALYRFLGVNKIFRRLMIQLGRIARRIR